MNGKKILSILGVVCGAELLVAAVIGGAGVGAFFGVEGAIVFGVLFVLVSGFVYGKYKVKRRNT